MIRNTLKSILFTGLFFFNLVNANNDRIEFIEFARNEVFIPERLGYLELYKDDNGFHIRKNGETYDIPNCFCDPFLQRMSNKQLMNFLGRNRPKIIILTPEEFSQINPDDFVEITGPEEDYLISQLFSSGYISIKQMDDGGYILRAEVRLLGGIGEETKKILQEGTKKGVLLSAIGIAGQATVTAVTTAVAQSAAIAATEAAIAAGGPAAAAIAAATAGQAGVGGAALAGAVGGTITALPIAIICLPVMIGLGIGYVYFKRRLTKPSENPAANPPAGATPGGELTPQAIPAVKIRIIEGPW